MPDRNGPLAGPTARLSTDRTGLGPMIVGGLVTLALLILLASQCSSAGRQATPAVDNQPIPTTAATIDPADGPDGDGQPDNPVDVPSLRATLEATGQHATLIRLLDQVGGQGLLDGDGPITLFAPTDAAFESVDPLVYEDPDLLRDVLLHHSVPGLFESESFTHGQRLTSSVDQTLVIGVTETIRVDGVAVIQPDLIAANGIAHSIDTVLLTSEISDIFEEIAQLEADAQALHGEIEELSGILTGLQGITFQSGSATITGDGEAVLERAVEALLGTSLSVAIEGHTDDQGDAAFNLTLSVARAQAVLDYLVGQGVDPQLLTATGFGDTVPIADNNTPEGRVDNRRIEFVIEQG